MPLLTQLDDVDAIASSLTARMKHAAHTIMPEVRTQSASNTFPRQSWFNTECKSAQRVKAAIVNNAALSGVEKDTAVLHFHAGEDRVKKSWQERRAADSVNWLKSIPVASGRSSRFRSMSHAQLSWQHSSKLSAFSWEQGLLRCIHTKYLCICF